MTRRRLTDCELSLLLGEWDAGQRIPVESYMAILPILHEMAKQRRAANTPGVPL